MSEWDDVFISDTEWVGTVPTKLHGSRDFNVALMAMYVPTNSSMAKNSETGVNVNMRSTKLRAALLNVATLNGIKGGTKEETLRIAFWFAECKFLCSFLAKADTTVVAEYAKGESMGLQRLPKFLRFEDLDLVADVKHLSV